MTSRDAPAVGRRAGGFADVPIGRRIAGSGRRTGSRLRLRGRGNVPVARRAATSCRRAYPFRALRGLAASMRTAGGVVSSPGGGGDPGALDTVGIGTAYMRLHGSGYRRRAVRMRMPRRYRVLLRGLMLAAVVVGVALGAWLAQAGG